MKTSINSSCTSTEEALVLLQNHEYSLQDIPEQFRTPEVCDLAVMLNTNNIEYVPKIYISNLMLILVATKSEFLIYNDRKKNKSKEFYTVCISNGISIFTHIPLEILDYNMCVLSVCEYPKTFEHVPEQFKTYELIKLAVMLDGINLYYVHPECITKELVTLAVQQNNLAIRYVPFELLTEDLCITAINGKNNCIQDIPRKFLTEKVYKLSDECAELMHDEVKELFNNENIGNFAGSYNDWYNGLAGHYSSRDCGIYVKE